MKKLLLCILLILLNACNEKSKHFRYQLKVVNETDTTQNFSIYTDFNEDYDFFDEEQKDSIIFANSSLSKVDGRFLFGFINNKHSCNKILFFSSETAQLPDDIDEHRKVMISEFNTKFSTADRVLINCYENYLDTSNEFPTKYLSYLIAKSSKEDTVGFQENVYLRTPEKLITTVVIYTDQIYKRELQEVAKELKSK